MWFWKHKTKKAIIKQECFDKLPPAKQKQFVKDKPIKNVGGVYHTHIVHDDNTLVQHDYYDYNEDSSVLNTIILTDVIETIVDNDSQIDPVNDFGGGSGGGSGASDTWTPDPPTPDFEPDNSLNDSISDSTSWDNS